MAAATKRSDLQKLARSKLDDATFLVKDHRFSNGYYLAGYAIELGLKACIARQFTADAIPDKSFVNDIYQHNLVKLVGVAGLTKDLADAIAANKNFGTNWGIAAQWKESSRYETIDRYTAQTMIEAVTHSKSGVLQWIEKFW